MKQEWDTGSDHPFKGSVTEGKLLNLQTIASPSAFKSLLTQSW